jgi:hypothetical protein
MLVKKNEWAVRQIIHQLFYQITNLILKKVIECIDKAGISKSTYCVFNPQVRNRPICIQEKSCHIFYTFLPLIRARKIQQNMLQKLLAVAINFLRYFMKNIKSLPVCD